MKNVVIVSGSRTPVGSFGGSLKSVPVVELGTYVMKDVLKRVGLKPAVDASQDEFSPDTLKQPLLMSHYNIPGSPQCHHNIYL